MRGEHVAQLIVEGFGVLVRIEVVVFLAPEGPATSEAVEDLAGVPLGAGERLAAFSHLGVPVLIDLRDPGFAEILLDEDVHRDLGPLLGDLDPIHREDQAPVGVSDFGGSLDELDGFVRVFSGACKATRDLHIVPSTSPSVAAIRRKTPP